MELEDSPHLVTISVRFLLLHIPNWSTCDNSCSTFKGKANRLAQDAFITMQTSDKKIIQTDIQIAMCFVTIKETLENMGMTLCSSVDPPQDPYLAPLPQGRSDEGVAWDADFMKVDIGTWFELIPAVHYLDIEALHVLICKSFQITMGDRTSEEI